MDIAGQLMSDGNSAMVAVLVFLAATMLAFSVMAVSSRVSPFLMADCATDMLITSAPSRLPASSKK